MPAFKVGRQWRFPTTQIENWLRHQGTQEASIDLIQNGKNTIAEQIPLECVQLIQDTFADALGVMVIITDMDGKPVTEFSNPCGLFSALGESPKLWETCMSHWREMAATISIEPQYARSFLGLLCARGLIRVGKELEGMVFIGGIAPYDWPPSDATSRPHPRSGSRRDCSNAGVS